VEMNEQLGAQVELLNDKLKEAKQALKDG